MTPSPTDIQERETIARIIDPKAFKALDDATNHWPEDQPNSKYWSDLKFLGQSGVTTALAKADAIFLALRSNPQPGSEGVSSYDAGLLSDYGGGNVEWWQDYIRAELDRAHEFYAAQFGDLASSPTPAQPGEVERLRSELEGLKIAIGLRRLTDRVGEALIEGVWPDDEDLAAVEAIANWWNARAALTPKGGEEGNV